MNVKTFTLNEIGGRKNVEDAILPKTYTPHDPQLFIVCDGVGGSSFGEVASDIATHSFYEVFKHAVIGNEYDFKAKLQEALSLFQQKVGDYVETNPGAASTSTTLTLLTIHQHQAYLAWCGDSKIFQLRNGCPVFKSRDHSLVAELIAQGVITEKEALTHPQRNIITRSLSTHTKQSDIESAIVTDIRDGDWFLLCTDGLMEQFTEDQFATVLHPFHAGTDYTEVIDNICRNKTKDNYSMYLLHVSGASKNSGGKKMLLPVLLVLLLGIGGWFAYSQLSGEKKIEPVPAAEKKDTVKSIMMVRPQEDSSTRNDSMHTIKKDTTQH